LKKDKLRVYVLEFILLAILSFTLFVSNIYSLIVLAGLFTVCAVATWFFIKRRKVESVHAKKVTMLLIFFGIIYLIAFYTMGLYFGYNNSIYTLNAWSLTNLIIPTAVIIISSEVMRNVLLAQNTKSTKIITFIIMVMIDVIIYLDIYNMKGFDQFVDGIGFTLFASIACNLLYNYTSSRYGFVGNVFYRMLTVLYAYIIPIVPDLPMLFRSILRMVYPYLIYQVLEYTFVTKTMSIAREDKRKRVISQIVSAIVIIIGAMLISCQFKYGILVIGSESMTGTINKGDAIVFEQYKDDVIINEGDVVIFDTKVRQLVHRVIAIKNVNGETRYTTKGDANMLEDEGYITDSDITGICKFRIPAVGYPTVWLNEAFSK